MIVGKSVPCSRSETSVQRRAGRWQGCIHLLKQLEEQDICKHAEIWASKFISLVQEVPNGISAKHGRTDSRLIQEIVDVCPSPTSMRRKQKR